MKILHVVQDYDAGEDDARRIAAAEATWYHKHPPWDKTVKIERFRLGPDSRSSLDIGDHRGCPYIMDIMDHACHRGDFVAFTNSDISLCTDTWAWVFWSLSYWPCGYSLRADYNCKEDYPSRPMSVAMLNADPHMYPYPGADMFWCTSAWWHRARGNFPDLILGYEAWDWVMKRVMQTNGFRPCPRRMIYHERHASFWEAHKLDCPGQEYNRPLAMEWARRNGGEGELRHEMGPD